MTLVNSHAFLACGIGGPMPELAQKCWRMTLEHLRHFDDGAQTAPHTPRVALNVEVLGTRRVHIPPKPAELRFDRQGSALPQPAPFHGLVKGRLSRVPGQAEERSCGFDEAHAFRSSMAKAPKQKVQRLSLPSRFGTTVFTPSSGKGRRGSRATRSVVNRTELRCRQRRSLE